MGRTWFREALIAGGEGPAYNTSSASAGAIGPWTRQGWKEAGSRYTLRTSVAVIEELARRGAGSPHVTRRPQRIADMLLIDRGTPDAQTPLLHYRECVNQLLIMLSHRDRSDSPLLLRRDPVQANEKNTVVNSLLAKHQLSEVFVRRHKYGLIPGRHLEDLFIGDPWTHLGYVRHLMTVRAKRLDELTLHSLVAQESQVAPAGIGYTTSAFRAPAANEIAASAASRVSRG